MQPSQRAPVGTAETVPTSVDRALRGVFAFVFFAVTIASIAFSIATSGKPSPNCRPPCARHLLPGKWRAIHAHVHEQPRDCGLARSNGRESPLRRSR